MAMTRSTLPFLRLTALGLILALVSSVLGLPVPALGPAQTASADAEADATRRTIAGLGKRLRKLARSPHVLKKLDEVNTILDALAVHASPAAGLEALGGAAIPDEKVRARIFAFAEENHDKKMLKPLIGLLEHKDTRRDVPLKRLIVHALSVLADPIALEPLGDLIGFDEDAELVADVCAALGVFAGAKIEKRKPVVKALVDLYGYTYNLKQSIRPEDKILTKIASKRWRVYSVPMRTALQTLTGKQWTRSHEWRRWWNDCKKAKDWSKCKSKLDKRRTG